MKKIFLILFILSSFVFADIILTTSVGKLNPTSKVIGGYDIYIDNEKFHVDEDGTMFTESAWNNLLG